MGMLVIGKSKFRESIARGGPDGNLRLTLTPIQSNLPHTCDSVQSLRTGTKTIKSPGTPSTGGKTAAAAKPGMKLLGSMKSLGEISKWDGALV